MRALPLLLLLACNRPEAGPLGIPLATDGVLYAGASQRDVTPEITETWTDGDGDGEFTGCLDDPTGASCGSADTWTDTDGDGRFDAVFIAGFGPYRPANSVHDPITISAAVFVQDGSYVAYVAMDYVGLHAPRIDAARAALVAEGFDGDRLLVSSSHNHQGPDVFGIWGNPFDFANPVSGLVPEYQARVEAEIAEAVREAAAEMVPVELTIGRVRMRDRGSVFNGSVFGGYNPTPKMHGMIHDIRDPVLASDQLLVLQANAEDGTVLTLTNWSGHPETWGGDNTALSADWVGKTREVLAQEYGGIAMHLPESLGGMQSALGGHVPLVDELGEPQLQACSAEEIAASAEGCTQGQAAGAPKQLPDGTPMPVWVGDESWDFARSHGFHIAWAAIDALAAGETVADAPIRVAVEPAYFPVENSLYRLFLPLGITELTPEMEVFDPALCPEAMDGGSCMPMRTSRSAVGPVGFVHVPGELLPEIAWGLPTEDPLWVAEAADPTARGPESRYFPQHPRACDTVDPTECLTRRTVGDCDCLSIHTWPYTIGADASVPPLLDALDTEYKAVIGMSDHYLSYIVPESDYNRAVSYLDGPGDHYEDSVSPAHNLATRVQEAQARISERW